MKIEIPDNSAFVLIIKQEDDSTGFISVRCEGWKNKRMLLCEMARARKLIQRLNISGHGRPPEMVHE